ncbi:MAG: hypothetical protein NC253_09525 [Ruminococcus sp.]|nr:hypothetical protein [Ruminococcus sp.]MCM1480052.1 hypothetical protein [Muribaculaceae bacterium]
MKMKKLLACMAAAVMAVSAVLMAAIPAAAIPAAASGSAYAEFSSLEELNEHIAKYKGSVVMRDTVTDRQVNIEDVQSIRIPAGFSQYDGSISVIVFCEEYVSVTFTFSNGAYTFYDFGNSEAGKMHYDSMKNSTDKQKVDGRTVYRSGAYYCWKQSGSYFMLVTDARAFGYCSAEEYILPEYAEEGVTYIGGKKYYVQSDGSYYVGWKTVGGKKYFFGMDGAAITENMIIGNVRYTFDESGVCTGTYTGWITMRGNKYYCRKGRFVTGVNTISGTTYTFNSEGVLIG